MSTERVTLRDYFLLTKPTITLLVVITTIPGLLLSQSQLPSMSLFLATLFGAGLASASAAVFNQSFEVGIDNAMARTKRRSLPSGRVRKWQALLWGTSLGVVALVSLYFYCSPLAASLALAGHLFYVLFYTGYLKKRTPQNIVIGGAAGAVGPLIGWASTGNLSLTAWVMFLIITVWTPPHFWALALNYKEDYAQAGIPMYPVVYGDERTRKVIFLYTLGLIPLIASLYFLKTAGLFYLTVSGLLTLRFSWLAWVLYRTGDNRHSMPLFHFSCLYTFAVFSALSFDHLFTMVVQN